MSNQNYFDLMRETSFAVDPIIEKYTDDTCEVTAELPRRRIGQPRLRDLAVRLGYEISGGSNWQEVIPVCASYELLNCSTYVLNWIFDEKDGKKSQRRINDLIIAGVELRELSERILRDHELVVCTEGIHKINTAVYQGQRLDLNDLTIENIGDFKDFDEFVKVYERRCSGLSGEFYAQSLSVGARLVGAKIELLYEVGRVLGSGLQASNDVGDFALPDGNVVVLEKPYKDQFSDLQQGKLTIPIYLMLTRGTPQQRRTLESVVRKEELAEEDLQKVIEILYETEAFQLSYQFLKRKHKDAKRKLYSSFGRSYQRDLIARLLVSITSNKFLAAIRKSLPAH